MKAVVALAIALFVTVVAAAVAQLLAGLVVMLTRNLPVYFHVLLLIDLGLFCWASNIHVLLLSGISVNRILHFSKPQPSSSSHSLPTSNPSSPDGPLVAQPFQLLSLVPSHLYKISLVYSLLTALAIASFSTVVWGMGGSEEKAEFIPILAYLLALFLLVGLKEDVFFGRERKWFMSALGRIAFGTLSSPVPFCDVIFADILTSFSKVLGDLHLVAQDFLSHDASHDARFQLAQASADVVGETGASRMGDVRREAANGGPTTGGTGGGSGGGRWMEVVGVVLVCLPFLFRLRQCLAEYRQTTNNPAAQSRHLFNALKYCTAFPVIAASWLINWVRSEVTKVGAVAAAGVTPTAETHSRLVTSVVGSEGRVDEKKVEMILNVAVGIWIFFSIVNSVYSLYWDIYMDWHLGNWPGKSVQSARRSSVVGPTIHLNPLSASSSSSSSSSSMSVPSSSTSSPVSKPPMHSSSTSSPQGTLFNPKDSAYHHRAYGEVSTFAENKSQPPSNNGDSHPFPFFLRRTLHFRQPWIYYLAIALNTLLRMSWIVRVAVLQALLRKSFAAGARGGHHHDLDVELGDLRGVLLGLDLGLKGLEVLRRWVWVFFRVEREYVSGRERGVVREINPSLK
ncbi:hypothetical protein HDU78_000676 [Chytriomyces hyalinus]|nr:hypothetical protein HDU78_000676 [Chytriomyces hyalinus]